MRSNSDAVLVSFSPDLSIYVCLSAKSYPSHGGENDLADFDEILQVEQSWALMVDAKRHAVLDYEYSALS